MATVDLTHGKLKFPPRFLPYLEKHRIFELFHECVELLIQVKPRDHVEFLKNVMPCAAMKKDKQRIVFLSPVGFDRATFSELLADCLGIQNMNLALLLEMTRDRLKPDIPSYVSETVEEESCICPGEAEFPGFPLYYPQIPGEVYEEKVEEEEVCAVEPCVCVCPCMANAEKEKEEEEEEEDENEPCIPRPRKKHRKDCKRKTPEISEISETYKTELVEEESTTTGIDTSEIMFEILAECEQGAKGWILEDFPLTGEAAENLNSLGVIPTHALRIIVDEKAEEKDIEYKAVVQSWMNAYKFVPVLEIRKKNRGVEELVKDMCSLLALMPHRHAPMLPRIVLIGSRGAGVTTQGQKLARKYGLVHVEYDLVINRALQQDDEICKKYKFQLSTRPDPELEALILERALTTTMCRNRGWVLTGYPTNIDQMRMLDIIATPPNRVIFIEVPPRECFVRLYYRKIDPCSGEEYKLPETEPGGLDLCLTPDLDPQVAARLLPHPRNDRKQIIHDIEEYFINKKEMMAYCGRTASYVDGNQEVDRVLELIEQIIINPSPPHPPRDPLVLNYGIQESYERLKKFRIHSGLFYNDMLLNPPERIVKP